MKALMRLAVLLTAVAFPATVLAQNYTDIPGEKYQSGNAGSEAQQYAASCGLYAYKVDPPLSGSYPLQTDYPQYIFVRTGTGYVPGASETVPSDVIGIISVTIYNDGTTLDWSIAAGWQVCAVIVKGGPGARVYTYPGAISGTGLTPPINPKNNKPYAISHVTFVFSPREPMSCWADETAWAAGTRYVEQGNWATYTPYVANSTVILYAGQTMAAGTVYFSEALDGQITITITLNSGWRFAPVDENVKIQDYPTAPSGNPAPGQFAWKGKATASPFSITVPANNFYGVHVDVQREVPCPVQ